MSENKNVLYRLNYSTELHMKPAKKKKAKIFLGFIYCSSLKYGEIDEAAYATALEKTDFDEIYNDARYRGWGINAEYADPCNTESEKVLMTSDPQSLTTKEDFVKLVRNITPEIVDDSQIPLLQLIRELSKEEFILYIKDKLDKLQ